MNQKEKNNKSTSKHLIEISMGWHSIYELNPYLFYSSFLLPFSLILKNILSTFFKNDSCTIAFILFFSNGWSFYVKNSFEKWIQTYEK